ncbi:MAG: hypothetical protein JXB32_04580 [Deltaproteobacteria bacterium]|nr:hypothetical protein [Deltaproteobacteria bacterium]
MSRGVVGLWVLAALAWSRPAAGDSFVLAAEFGEQYVYLSPWEQGEPLTDFGLRFYMNEDEVDFGFGLKYARNWGGELLNAGAVALDFTVRLHEDRYYGGESFVPYVMFGPTYSHRWAEDERAAAAGGPASWTTREGFGLRLGGGFFVTVDEFYFDFTLYGVTELLWPEPAWVAGGGLDLGFGIFIS